MTSDIDQFNNINLQLVRGEVPNPVVVRQLMSWCGVQRRSYWNRHYIDQELEKAGIETQPNYKETWVDAPVNFVLAKISSKEADTEEAPKGAEEVMEDDTVKLMLENFSYQIGRLEAANRDFVFVRPNAPVGEALSKMLFNNFSQLPVMTSEYTLKGVVSFASVCARMANGLIGDDVQFYMDDAREISSKASLFSAAKTIAEAGYVLVRGQDNKITGIVTSSDLNMQMEQMSTPFLLLSEIENHVRELIKNRISLDRIKEMCGVDVPQNFSDVAELTFGNYVRIMQQKDAWPMLGLKLDQKYFCEELDQVRQIRNDVMHFDPDPIDDRELTRLRNFSRIFDQLRNIGAL